MAVDKVIATVKRLTFLAHPVYFVINEIHNLRLLRAIFLRAVIALRAAMFRGRDNWANVYCSRNTKSAIDPSINPSTCSNVKTTAMFTLTVLL